MDKTINRPFGPARLSDRTPPGPSVPALGTPRKIRQRGFVWLGAALVAAVLQADL
jgi:hypothetical protein